MLVLTRNKSQSIMIGDDITVTVLGISKHQVRLGISAPREVPVHREEIAVRIAEEKAAKEGEDSNGKSGNW